MRVMHNVIMIAVCCMPSQVLGVEALSVAELLDRLTESQDKLRSLVAKSEEIFVSTQSNKSAPSIVRWVTETRMDGTRTYRRMYRWLNLPAKDAPAPMEDSNCFLDLWDGTRCINYYKNLRGPGGPRSRRAYISRDEAEMKDTVIGGGYSMPLFGIRYSHYERIDSVLRQAASISVRDKLEQVGSAAYYVIDAKANSGTYTVWLDPEHGYNIAKADIRLGPNAFFGHRGKRLKDGASESLSIKNVRFENVDGVWIPMEADLYSVSIRQDGSSISSDLHHKVTEITLDPDHDELGSFIADIEDGTPVRDRDFGISYTWQNGELIPDVDEAVIEQIDKMAEEIMAEGQVPPALATARKTEATPNEPAAPVDTEPEVQADTAQGQREVLSESRPFPILVLIVIGLSIIAVVAWRAFRLKGR